MNQAVRVFEVVRSHRINLDEAVALRDYIENTLRERESECQFELKSDITLNGKKVAEQQTIAEVLEFIKLYMMSDFVTVYVTCSGKMTIVLYDNDEVRNIIVVNN